jgi:DUF971 family protein
MTNPTEIILHKQTKMLELAFDDGSRYKFPFEFLRVYSPSAEVRGHGKGQETLQVGKRDVVLDNIEPAGNYALKLAFNDGHDSGLYSWEYFLDLGKNQDSLWQDYLTKMEAAGESRF